MAALPPSICLRVSAIAATDFWLSNSMASSLAVNGVRRDVCISATPNVAMRVSSVGQPILKRSKMIFTPLMAISAACSGVMFFSVMCSPPAPELL
jgi:hypothetical protein